MPGIRAVQIRGEVVDYRGIASGFRIERPGVETQSDPVHPLELIQCGLVIALEYARQPGTAPAAHADEYAVPFGAETAVPLS